MGLKACQLSCLIDSLPRKRSGYNHSSAGTEYSECEFTRSGLRPVLVFSVLSALTWLQISVTLFNPKSRSVSVNILWHMNVSQDLSWYYKYVTLKMDHCVSWTFLLVWVLSDKSFNSLTLESWRKRSNPTELFVPRLRHPHRTRWLSFHTKLARVVSMQLPSGKPRNHIFIDIYWGVKTRH